DAAEQEIDSAERKLAIDKKALKKAKDKLEADERACNGSSSSSKRDDDDDDDDDDDGPSTSGSPGLNSGLVTMSNPACSQIPADKQAVVSAKQQVVDRKSVVEGERVVDGGGGGTRTMREAAPAWRAE